MHQPRGSPCRGEETVVLAHHQGQAFGGGQGYQLGCDVEFVGERLLHEHVQTRLEPCPGERCVASDRGRDQQGFWSRRGEGGVERTEPRRPRAGQPPGEELECAGIGIDITDHLDLVDGGVDAPGPVAAPVPQSDLHDAKGSRHPEYRLARAASNDCKAGDPTLALLMAEPAAQTAFADEALTHLDTLYRGALRLTHDPDAAQDLVQEAYLRALRYQHSYQAGTNMKAWLFAIMRNLFWDRFKGSRKDDVSLDDLGEFVLYEKLRDEGARPEADVLDKIAASEVVAAVDKLPPLHREVVLLVDVEGFSYKDAAQTLGVPIGTVMSRLHRARQQLQKSLYDYARESGIVRPNGPSQVAQT